jgi:hypothetical protein
VAHACIFRRWDSSKTHDAARRGVYAPAAVGKGVANSRRKRAISFDYGKPLLATMTTKSGYLVRKRQVTFGARRRRAAIARSLLSTKRPVWS